MTLTLLLMRAETEALCENRGPMSANPMDVDIVHPTWRQATTIREANGTKTPVSTFESGYYAMSRDRCPRSSLVGRQSGSSEI